MSVLHLLLLRDTFAIILLYTSYTYFMTVHRDSISCTHLVTVCRLRGDLAMLLEARRQRLMFEARLR